MMNQQRNSSLSPWEPYRLMSYFVFLTVFGAGILLALNWKRLGKPEWQGKTMLLSIFLPLLMIAMAIGWLILLMPNRDLPSQFVLSIPMLAFGVNIGYLWALARLQNGAYKVFKSQGPDALVGFNYDVDGALFFGGIVAIFITLIAVFVFPLFG
jgi:hypothetical protein